MKKLLLLPLLVIACFCFAQDAKDIIGKPVKIGTLLVAQNDFPKQMNWENAKLACEALGRGWRLPSKDELNILYQNKDKIGGFTYHGRWCSTEKDNRFAWRQGFLKGNQYIAVKSGGSFVRAVRDF